MDKKTKSINFWMLELFFRLPLPLLQMSRATVSPTMSTSIKKSQPVIFTGRPYNPNASVRFVIELRFIDLH
ncbi:hypothetical protein CMV16_11145 [Peribacillus simplex]|nr:hypothetical protein CMV16_11145 [Peribacillus simplex]